MTWKRSLFVPENDDPRFVKHGRRENNETGTRLSPVASGLLERHMVLLFWRGSTSPLIAANTSVSHLLFVTCTL